MSKILPRSSERGNPNIPIRTVLYLEVQDLPANDVRAVTKEIMRSFPNEHPHYLMPLRFGKLMTDIEFEGEILGTIRTLCEVNEAGEIVLRGGAEQVDVIRKKIN